MGGRVGAGRVNPVERTWRADVAWPVRFSVVVRDRFQGRRRLVVSGLDVGAWGSAVALATGAQHGADMPARSAIGVAVLVAVAAVTVLAIGALSGLHRGRYIVGSIEEIVAVISAFAATGAVVNVANLLFAPRLVPLSASVGAVAFALVIALLPRIWFGYALDHTRAPDPAASRRLLVFGAGDAGNQIVRALVREQHGELLPVALIDDDPDKANRSIHGVRVMGDRRAIPRLARVLRADTLLVAAPSAEPALKQELAKIADDCGLELRILPRLSDLVASAIDVTDIREVTEADLLGRPQVEIDLDAIAGYLRGKRVLVTGAGGSIGSEICRQVRRFEPSGLVLLDRDESALHAVQLSLEGRALLNQPNLVVADIRDRERLHDVLNRWRPEVVFHAAALKHLPLLELHPDEGVKTNVRGTQHLLEAATAFGCGRFVNISTDKAADPVSVLGATKLIAERLTADAARRTGRPFLSVRFGNVLGSRGSVLPTFRTQIEAGGPVTVTHPEVTRFFMTTEEAVSLVIQAAAIGRPGEVLILDMGKAVRIDDVARRLIARSGRNIDVQYTGLRPGEKLHERLVGTNEVAASRGHPLILHTTVEPIDASVIDSLTAATLLDVVGPILDREPLPNGAESVA